MRIRFENGIIKLTFGKTPEQKKAETDANLFALEQERKYREGMSNSPVALITSASDVSSAPVSHRISNPEYYDRSYIASLRTTNPFVGIPQEPGTSLQQAQYDRARGAEKIPVFVRTGTAVAAFDYHDYASVSGMTIEAPVDVLTHVKVTEPASEPKA